MSDLTYLHIKTCSWCGVYLNKVNKTCIRRINEELFTKINSVKNTILINKKKPPNDTIIQIGGCRSYANKYGTVGTSRSPVLTTITSIILTTRNSSLSRNITDSQNIDL